MLWETCRGAACIEPVEGIAFRLVESQEQVATRSMVDTLEEQSVLEELLDEGKPPYPPNSEGYHYLLTAPFRYPPLQYGSRFGSRAEASLFYAAKTIKTTLAEAAYYRGVYWHSMSEPPPRQINTEHSLFSVGYQSDCGLRLQHQPFSEHVAALTHPNDYRATQALGKDMRNAGIKAFEYVSARDTDHGICVGLFELTALNNRAPVSQEIYFCDLSSTEALFKPREGRTLYRYALADFELDGAFPAPPN